MQNIRLLLVDDEDDFRNTLAKRLSKKGISPMQAENGEKALTILENKRVDVVVLDVKMPGMDGIAVLEHIKKKYPKTEVIFLTGHAATQDGVEGIKTGAFDYLSKPIEFEHLFGKIKQAYEKIKREEEKLKEAEFRKYMEEQMMTTERLASLGTLAAGVAHEINNPLAIINESAGWLKLILSKEEMAGIPRKKDFEKALNKIEKGVERAKRITCQLLGFAKKDDSVFAEVDLVELVEEAIHLVKREAANKDIQIVSEIDPDTGTIWSDAYQFRQVLINLLTNAIYATAKGGRITIILEAVGDNVKLTVRDNGQGIPKENMKKIFEPFFSTKPPSEGTGLGLFVTRGIVEKLCGTIEVESRLGDGTSFYVNLPRYCKIKEDLDQDERIRFLDRLVNQSKSTP
ncbi:MAG: response regulator [Desulfobacteraceae bacterium]|nr:response regulator [Desulfobacteraceae bacterium]